MDDNYSDEIGDNFEEEYIDDELEESTKKVSVPLKNDFWEAPKKQITPVVSNPIKT
jgi:hypothetical protein